MKNSKATQDLDVSNLGNILAVIAISIAEQLIKEIGCTIAWNEGLLRPSFKCTSYEGDIMTVTFNGHCEVTVISRSFVYYMETEKGIYEYDDPNFTNKVMGHAYSVFGREKIAVL